MNPTQEMIKRLFLSIAISVAALIAGTSSVAAAVTRCDGPLSGTHDTVLVPEGKNCEVVDTVIVQGNVILQEGASLTIDCNVFTVNGNLLGDGVNSVIIKGEGDLVSIHGNVSITGATGEVQLDFVTIGGNLNISDSNGTKFISVAQSQVAGNALFQNNTTDKFSITANRITGNLVCNGNNDAPLLGTGPNANTVGGQRIGQCSQ